MLLSAFITMILLAFSVVTLLAQSDTTQQDSDESVVGRRKANAEWFLGVSSYSTTVENQPRLDDDAFAAQAGIGAHVPIIVTGRLTALWVVPMVVLTGRIVKQVSGTPNNSLTVTTVALDIALPVYVTYSYGGMRKKSNPFGIEAGLGLNVARRFEEQAFTIAPSAILDLSYAPKNIHRLRLMVDLMKAPLNNGVSLQTWSLSIVFGL